MGDLWQLEAELDEAVERLMNRLRGLRRSKRQWTLLELAAIQGGSLEAFRELASRQKAKEAKEAKEHDKETGTQAAGRKGFWETVHDWSLEVELMLKKWQDRGLDADELFQALVLRCTAEKLYQDKTA